jgi:hypothetical protein
MKTSKILGYRRVETSSAQICKQTLKHLEN